MLTRVPPEVTPVTRRRVLMGAATAPVLLLATACTEEPVAPVAPDPDRDALQAAFDIEGGLLAALSSWTAPSGDDKTAVLQVIESHIDALRTSLGSQQSSGSASPSSPAESTVSVTRMLDAAADEHSRALRTASPPISPLLASIAASDAALAASLRGSSR